MDKMEKQKKVYSYTKKKYDENIIDHITKEDYEKIIDSNITYISPEKPQDFPSKNEKLGDPLYSVFGYPSKVYYKIISKFIQAYSKPGETVLDSMAGSGTTAIASLLEGRKIIVNDGSKLAFFILKNITLPIEPTIILQYVDEIEDNIKGVLDELYAIPCECCGSIGEIKYIIESDVYKCPNCNTDYSLFGNEADGKSNYKCPSCGHNLKTNIPGNKKYRTSRRKPIEVKYKCENCKCGNSNHTKKVDEKIEIFWNEKISKYESLLDELFIPNKKLITDRWYTRKNGWPGIEKGASFKDFFTKRNLISLALLNEEINNISNKDIREQLKFVFLSGLIRSSKRMYKTSVVKTYYQVPSVGKVQNVWLVFKRKLRTFLKSKKELRKFPKLSDLKHYKDRIRVLNKDAKNLPLQNNSIDYIFLDPPYGSQIGYYELNTFFTSWLENTDENLEDEVIIPMETDKEEKFVKEWGEQMRKVFRECIRVLKPHRYITIMFHHNSDMIWNEFRDIFDELNTKYVNYVDLKRGTTFHTNRLSDTSPKSAFITYIKEEEYKSGNDKPNKKIIKKELQKEFDDISKHSFREIQSKVIKIVYEKDIKDVPSNEEIEEMITYIKNHP